MPTEDTTFSSIISEPASLAPAIRLSWAISGPCVTHDACMLSMLSRYIRARAVMRRYSSGPANCNCGDCGFCGGAGFFGSIFAGAWLRLFQRLNLV